MYIPNVDKQNYPTVDESIGRVPKDCNKISKTLGTSLIYNTISSPSLTICFLKTLFFLKKDFLHSKCKDSYKI